jgi:hypothetical protein
MARVRLGRLPSTEGELARLALEQESIDVELIGQQLSALQGAIPAAEVMVELWVEQTQLERAQRVLTTLFKENTKEGDVRCPACGTTNPATFDVCWSCAADLSRAEQVAKAPPPAELPKKRPPVFTVLFAGAAVLFGFLLWQEKQLAKFAESPNVHFRWTSESCVVREVNGRMASRSCDYDHNGIFELTEEFDTKGRLVALFRDDDQNELNERTDSFDINGKLMRRDFDVDGDRRFERGEAYDVNERLVLRDTDSDGDGRVDRTEEFDAGTAP